MRWILENRRGWSVSKPRASTKKIGQRTRQKKGLLCFVPKASKCFYERTPYRWLAPPQRAPARGAPDCANYVATCALAQYDVVVVDRAIQILRVCLPQAAENAERAQRVETA